MRNRMKDAPPSELAARDDGRGYAATALAYLQSWAFYPGCGDPDAPVPEPPGGPYEHARQVRAVLALCSRLAGDRTAVVAEREDAAAVRADNVALCAAVEKLRLELNALRGVQAEQPVAPNPVE